METKLNLISEIARKDRKCKFNNLAHNLNVTTLKECFYLLKKNKAPGIDGVRFDEYEQNLTQNLENLVFRMKQFSYRPQPVKRVYIPKSKGKRRLIGIPALEDKIVQMCITRLLVAIYENDFVDSSYGFRPKRSCHDALLSLNQMIMENPVNYVIDADIKGFFDNVNHKWMTRCLEERIADKNFLRLIVRFMKSGIIESGKYLTTDEGTPQGVILSPILANIYLHYVLDLWMERILKRETNGYVGFVRYADDFIICVQYKDNSHAILDRLKERLKKFDLELSKEKTKVIEFGRYATENAKVKGKKPKTFDFLSFTHFCDRTRKGAFKVGRRTSRKKLTLKIQEMNLWLKSVRNTAKPMEWWNILKAKLRGHFQYYGVSGNYGGIMRYYTLTIKLIYKWLNRRSQKNSFNWEEFNKYLQRHPLPTPKIHHNLYTWGY